MKDGLGFGESEYTMQQQSDLDSRLPQFVPRDQVFTTLWEPASDRLMEVGHSIDSAVDFRHNHKLVKSLAETSLYLYR